MRTIGIFMFPVMGRWHQSKKNMWAGKEDRSEFRFTCWP